VVAPALAGLLAGVSVVSIDGVYYIIAGFSMLSIISLSRLPYFGAPTRDADRTFGGDIIEGFRYVRHSPALLGLLTMAIVPILFGMPYMMLMPIFADDVLHIGTIGLGYLMAATGIGALFGSLLVATLSDFRYKGMLLFVTAILFGVFLILFSQSDTYEISMFFLLGVGASSSTYMAVNNSLILLHTEEKYRGRVMSLYMMTIGIMPVAVLPAGILIDWLKDPGIVVGAGGMILIAFTLLVMIFRPNLRRL
jgi:predicted MFS family arabinose efflux permease